MTAEPKRPVNAFSVDVEDYFQVWAFSDTISPSSWDRFDCRVQNNVERLLEVLARHRTRATFFTLGWIAERFPGMIRDIAAAGHELASHGYGHARVVDLTPAAFREDVHRAKAILEDAARQRVGGYRAPSFSIGASTPWAHDILADTGHVYSSSVYPIKTGLYGTPDAPRFAYRTPSGLIEIPPTSVRLFGRNFPASGGGYFRLLPYAVSRWSLLRTHRIDAQPAIFYCHPWEIDCDQPRIRGAKLKSRVRHYLNLDHTLPRIERLLSDFPWDRIDRVFADRLPQAYPYTSS